MEQVNFLVGLIFASRDFVTPERVSVFFDEVTGKGCCIWFWEESWGMDAWFLWDRFAAISTLLLPCMPLWLEPITGWLYIGDRLESGEKCGNASYNWVSGVRVCNSVDRREGVSDDHDGGWLRKWSIEDSFKTMEDCQELGCENWSGVPKAETYIVLSTECAISTRFCIRDPSV